MVSVPRGNPKQVVPAAKRSETMRTLLCVPSFFSLGCANSSFMPVLALDGWLSLEGNSFWSLHIQKHGHSSPFGVQSPPGPASVQEAWPPQRPV